MKFILIVLFFVSLNSYAEEKWLCRNTASYASGNIFYSCGNAVAKDLNSARSNSLKNAKKEFKSFCNDSLNCKNQLYIVSPLRTDCEKIRNGYSCYRGLKYTISKDKKRSDMTMDTEAVRTLIEKKEAELKELQNKQSELLYLKKLDRDIEKVKTVDKLETEIEYLQDVKKVNYENRTFKGNAGFIFSSFKIPFDYGEEDVIGLGVEYETLLLGKVLGLRLDTTYILGLESEDKTISSGVPNTSSDPKNHTHRGVDLSLSIPVHISNITLSPKVGLVSVKYDTTVYSYNNFGTNLDTQRSSGKLDTHYFSLEARYQFKYMFVGLETRKFKNHDKLLNRFSIGISIGF